MAASRELDGSAAKDVGGPTGVQYSVDDDTLVIASEMGWEFCITSGPRGPLSLSLSCALAQRHARSPSVPHDLSMRWSRSDRWPAGHEAQRPLSTAKLGGCDQLTLEANLTAKRSSHGSGERVAVSASDTRSDERVIRPQSAQHGAARGSPKKVDSRTAGTPGVSFRDSRSNRAAPHARDRPTRSTRSATPPDVPAPPVTVECST